MKGMKLIAILMAASLTLVGCTPDDFGDKKSENKDSLYSENIELSIEKPKTLNPITNTDERVLNVLNLVYDGMFELNKNYNAVPKLAESYNVISNGKAVNIKLKDAKWHDGSDVTADDVAFTYSMIKANKTSPYNYMVKNIQDIKVMGSKDLTVNLKTEAAFSAELLTFPIVSQKQLSGKKADDLSANKIGNGIYKITKYTERGGMKLEVNKDYYGEVPKGAKNINVNIVPDEEAVVSMVEALESDISKIGINDLSKFQGDQFTVRNYEGRDYECVLINQSNPLMANVNFRKALSYAIDRNEILEKGYMGNITSVNIPINSNSKYYDESVKPIGFNKSKAYEFIKKIKIDNKVKIKETNVKAEDLRDNSGSKNNSKKPSSSSGGGSSKPSAPSGGNGGESKPAPTPAPAPVPDSGGPSGDDGSGGEARNSVRGNLKDDDKKLFDLGLFSNFKSFAEEKPSKEESKENESKDNKDSKEAKNNKKGKDDKEPKEKYYTEAQIKSFLSTNNFKIIVNKNEAERVKSANIIAEDLKNIGVKSDVILLDSVGMQKALQKKSYDLAITGWQLSSVPDITQIMNQIAPSDNKLKGYLSEIAKASTREEVKSIYSKIEKHCIDNALFISIGVKDNYIVTNNRLESNMYLNDFDQYRGIESFKMK